MPETVSLHRGHDGTLLLVLLLVLLLLPFPQWNASIVRGWSEECRGRVLDPNHHKGHSIVQVHGERSRQSTIH